MQYALASSDSSCRRRTVRRPAGHGLGRALGHAAITAIVTMAIMGLPRQPAQACPFCAATMQTLSEEISSSDIAVLASIVKPGKLPERGPDDLGGFGFVDPETGLATFRIEQILKGEQGLRQGDTIEAIFFGDAEKEKRYMITGIGTEKIDWTTPLPLGPTSVEYVNALLTLPSEGPDRLDFFQRYFEHDVPLLAQDAYEEFARAPYDEVQALKPRMDHDRLVSWIATPDISPSRRRLYLTMLGVCGSEDDVPFLESMILSDEEEVMPPIEGLIATAMGLGGPIGLPLAGEIYRLDERRKKLGLDAMIACYLTLGGPSLLDKIDARFLANPDAEYTHIYSTCMALRFHGEETDILPRERLLQSVRLLLDNPDFADQVVPDLARWEDWEIMDRLVTLFTEADDRERRFVRQPIVTYMLAASRTEGEVAQRAERALEQLEEIDPKEVERARKLEAFGFLARARPSRDEPNGTRSGPNDDPLRSDDSPLAESNADVNDYSESSGSTTTDETFAAPEEIPPDPVDSLSAAERAETPWIEPLADEGQQPVDPAEASGLPTDEEDRLAGLETSNEGDVETNEVQTNPTLLPLAVGATILLTALFGWIIRAGAN